MCEDIHGDVVIKYLDKSNDHIESLTRGKSAGECVASNVLELHIVRTVSFDEKNSYLEFRR